MNKAVMISIQPKWCELIANGKKTVEVRKTRPKLETPFKVYIYETNWVDNTYWVNRHKGKLGKVIGYFVCENIERFQTYPREEQTKRVASQSCMTVGSLMEYQFYAPCLYAWHISSLVIYDKPKKLSEFHKAGYQETKENTYGWTAEEEKSWQIKRPPQSWCYVQEVDND